MSSAMSRPRKLTDDDVRDILLAPDELSHADLARRFDVSETLIGTVRRRAGRRALNIAVELGLIPLSPPRKCWTARGAKERTVSATVARVAAKGRGVVGRGGFSQ